MYNCAMFHHCRIYMTYLRVGFFSPHPPHLLEALETQKYPFKKELKVLTLIKLLNKTAALKL